MLAPRKSLLFLAVIGLLAVGLAGCLQSKTSEKDRVNRVYHVDVTTKALADAQSSSDPESAIRHLLRTDLVIHPGSAGDMKLTYATRSGSVTTETLTGLTPGVTRTVSDVDPFGAVTLAAADGAVKATRAPVNVAWWRVGDVPLGFAMTEGASATYALKLVGGEDVSVTDVATNDSSVRLDSVNFGLHLSTDGHASYDLGAATADGSPLRFSVDYSVPTNAPIVDASITGSHDGKPGTLGTVLSVQEGTMDGAISTWWREGQPVAGQFQGAHGKLVPTVTAWADGAFGEAAGAGHGGAFSCAGKSRADACHPTEIQSYESAYDAQRMQRYSESDYPHVQGNDKETKALQLLTEIFGQDVQPGDLIDLVINADSNELGSAADGSQFVVREEFSLEAVGEESVTVPAGTFNALKIVQSTIIDTSVKSLHEPGTTSYSYPTQPTPRPATPCPYDPSNPHPCAAAPTYAMPRMTRTPGPEVLRDFQINQTFARTTFWLDSATMQPVKVSSDLPLDVQQLYDEMLSSIPASTWQRAGYHPIDPAKVKIHVTLSSDAEATRISPGATYSAVDALYLGQLLGVAPALGPMAIVGAAVSNSHAGSQPTP